MPQYRNPFEKGDLFIKFDVQFPDNNWLSPEKLTVRPFYKTFYCSKVLVIYLFLERN